MSPLNDRSLPSEAVPLDPDKSLGELVSSLTSDLGDLVTAHIDLAKAEIKEEISETGQAAKVLSIGAFAAYMAIVMLSFTLAWALATWMPTWVGFLIVAVAWGAAGAVLLLMGKQRIQAIRPPEQTVETVKEDVAWVKHQSN